MRSAFHRHQRANLTAPIGAGPVYPLKNVQRYLLDAQALLTPSSMALGCLIAFDLVVLEVDLPLAYEALKSTHRYRGKPTIRWTQPPTTANQTAASDTEASTQGTTDPLDLAHDERTLSAFSWIACNQVVGDWLPFEQARVELIEVLSREPIRKRLPRDWPRLLHSAQTYAHTHLPSALRFHVLGQFRMVALTPAAAAREDSGLALNTTALDVDAEESIANTEASLSRSALSTRQLIAFGPEEIARERVMVEELARACNAGRGLPPVAARSAVLRAIHAIEIRLDESDTWSRVLMLVALRMVQEDRLAMPSIGRYFSGSACRLYDAIHHLKLGQLKAKEVVECIEAAHADAEQSNKASIKVVGQGVLDLLIDQEVIDPIKLSRAKQSAWRPPVRAQVIWAHEASRAYKWLDEAIRLHPNDPILQIVRCVIGIAQETGMRVGEVMRVRIGNLSIQDGHLQVTIAPTRSDPTLKSKEGRRLTFVRSPRVIGDLCEILCVRHGVSFGDRHPAIDFACVDTESINTELASRKGMLFQEPHHPNEIWHEAQVRKWISIVLKAATGDPRSTLYDLRHTWVSFGNEQDFCLENACDEKPFDRRANELGHAPSDLTFTTYTHIFGSGIRANVDRQVMHDQVLRQREVSAWAAMDVRTMKREIDQGKLQQANDRLRTQVSRACRRDENETGAIVLHRFIEAFSHSIAAPAPSAVYQISTVHPTSPLLGYRPGELTIEVLLRCLRQLPLSGYNDRLQHEVLARQAGVSSAAWSLALDELVFLHRSAAHVRQPSDEEVNPATWLIEQYWGRKIDSAFSGKWGPLLTYLDRQPADPNVRLASEYVLRTLGCGDYLPVRAADARFESLLHVFKACGINRSRLALHFTGETEKELVAAKHAASRIQSLLGIDSFPISRVQRIGRPEIYLTVRSQAGGVASDHNRDGSAHSMQGFSALFLGARLKAKMFEEQRHAG